MNKKQTTYRYDMPLDDYEKELEEFIEKGEFVSDPDFEKNKKMFQEAAKRHIELQKSKSITLRIKNEELIQIKAKAKRNGIAYQTLIGLLIRQYVENERKIAL